MARPDTEPLQAEPRGPLHGRGDAVDADATTRLLTARPADPDATVIRDPSFWERAPDPDATVIRGGTSVLAPADGFPAMARRAPVALPAGFALHEYRIERVLGQGGFGITYLARDINLDAPVAVKEYLPEEIAFRAGDASVSPNASRHRDRYQQGLDHFVVEARTLASFRHRAIVRVARYFEAHRTAYMVLEYERGQPLRQWWPQHAALGEAGLVERLVPLLEGLSTVHDAGVLHRDIKPDNIQVREHDSSFVLLDFGSALQTVAAAGQEAVVLTPGFAPIEQYGLGEQGPWTDVYAFGATLYWAVSGHKPPDAEQRAAGIHPQPAVEVGRGRYGQAFLRAIDWALEVDALRRPRSIADWRAALLADHLGHVALVDALQREAGGRPAAPQPQAASWRQALVRAGATLRRLADPRRWPLAVKFSVAFVASALLPMLLVASWNLAGSLRALESAQMGKSALMAHGVADRIAQLMSDMTHLARVLASDVHVVDALSEPEGPGLERLRSRLQVLVRADPDLSELMLLDASGAVRASTADAAASAASAASAAAAGSVASVASVASAASAASVASVASAAAAASAAATPALRTMSPAMLAAVIAGRAHVSALALHPARGVAGVQLAEPVRDTQGQLRGAVVLQLSVGAVAEVLDAMRYGAQVTPFLIDGDGLVVHHADPRRLHRSLAPLSAQRQAAIALERRLGGERIGSLGEIELAQALIGARQPGHVAYRSAVSGVDEIAGFAPVQGLPWVVGLAEPRAAFEAPLRALQDRLYWTLLLVGLLFAGLGLAAARSLVRPIRALTDGAQALQGGDFERARVDVRSADEVGQLARTFNVMVEVLQQRERQRRGQ